MIVTSFSQKGYHEYGKRFIETFLQFWPDERLRVYYENGIPSNAPKDERVEYVDLYSFDNVKLFEDVLKHSDPLFSGIMRAPNGQNVYNFRYDVNRFFRKAFCMYDACTRDPEPYVAWVDADVYFHSTMPAGFIKQLLPAGEYLAHLPREWAYTESGFVAFDTQHPMNKTFMELYMSTYFNGAFRYLGEWHDCYVLDYTIKLLAVPRVSLTVEEKSDHPFNESVLGNFMDHMKGPERKQQGKSHEHELKKTG